MKQIIIISEKIKEYILLPDYNAFDNIIVTEEITESIRTFIDISEKELVCLLIFASCEEWDIVSSVLSNKNKLEYRGILICPVKENSFYPNTFFNILDLRTTSISSLEFQFLVERAFFQMKKRHMLYDENIKLIELKDTYHDQELLVAIGRHLTIQKNPDELLKTILYLSKKITGADGGSIYLIEKDNKGKDVLKFKRSNTFSKDLPYEKLTIDLNKNSIAGYVALTGNVLNIDDVYNLSIKRFPGIKHNLMFDKKYKYRTKSMIIVPMKNHLNEIIGIIQLINCKENLNSGNWTGNEAFSIKLITKKDFDEKVFPFDRRYESLLEAIASQTAIALENVRMINKIRGQFDEFVKASVSAIESRDPTTYGHSFRVAKICIEIAKAINSEKKGVFKDIYFDENQLKELEYAALLHDFGKVNIDFKILLKAKKLFPKDFIFLQLKLDYLFRCIQLKHLEEEIGKIGKIPVKKHKENINRNLTNDDQLKKIEIIKEIIHKLIEPNIDEDETKKLIKMLEKEIKGLKCYDLQGNKIEIIDELEKMNLNIQKGSLNQKERIEVESHVLHTYNFVNQIPWPSEFKKIPEITYKHHEFLDGSGYPQGLKGKKNIPLESRIMTIADIFDALTAADRPYKNAVPIKEALNILKEEAAKNKIDDDILDVFIKYKVYKKL